MRGGLGIIGREKRPVFGKKQALRKALNHCGEWGSGV